MCLWKWIWVVKRWTSLDQTSTSLECGMWNGEMVDEEWEMWVWG